MTTPTFRLEGSIKRLLYSNIFRDSPCCQVGQGASRGLSHHPAGNGARMLLVYVSYTGIREYTVATNEKSVKDPGKSVSACCKMKSAPGIIPVFLPAQIRRLQFILQSLRDDPQTGPSSANLAFAPPCEPCLFLSVIFFRQKSAVSSPNVQFKIQNQTIWDIRGGGKQQHSP